VDRNLRFNQAGDLVVELEQLVARADEQITATLIDQRLQTAQATPTQTPDYTQYFKSQMAGYCFVG